MADTVFTADGRMHVLLGSTTLLGIIRDYCGDEVAARVERAINGPEKWFQDIENALYSSGTDPETFLLNLQNEIEQAIP